MYSIAFPKIFNGSKVNLNKDYDAVKVNLKSLLMSNRKGLYGDPYYGTALKRMLYEQNSILLKDLIIDELYTTVITFMPQIFVNRNDITVSSDGYSVYATLKCTNLIDYTVNLYTINLTEDAEQ